MYVCELTIHEKAMHKDTIRHRRQCRMLCCLLIIVLIEHNKAEAQCVDRKVIFTGISLQNTSQEALAKKKTEDNYYGYIG